MDFEEKMKLAVQMANARMVEARQGREIIDFHRHEERLTGLVERAPGEDLYSRLVQRMFALIETMEKPPPQ